MSLKRFLFAVFGFTLIAGILLPRAVFASRSSYFDFGPYYNQRQVLGFSFSSLENLPAPELPENILPPPASGLMPDSPFYPFEQVRENLQLTFTFDPVKKEELRLGFASERLSEARTLMEQGKVEAASTALDNYGSTIKDTAKALSGLSGNTEAVSKIEETISAQTIAVQNLALRSNPTEAEEWNLTTKVARHALDTVAEVRGEPSVPEELSTAVQKLKEQGLISEEQSNKLYGLEGRSEVRKELDKLVSSGQFPASELAKLDTAVAKNFPDVYKAMAANMQVAELRVYQTLPQPSEEILTEMERWQKDPGAPPANDIKPYLWHNRAEGLAQEVDLSHFPAEQQAEVAKLYPQAITDNPTYQPPVSPTPAPQSPSDVEPTSTDVQLSPAVSPAPPQAGVYLGETGEVLPGDRTYFIKQWGENFQVVFALDPAEKAKLKMQQAERRLAEAEAISSDAKKAALYGDVIKNYQKAMADASRFLKDTEDEEKAQEVAGKLESQAARHGVVLEKGLLPAPKDAKLITEAIKATEDALDRSADALGRPALPSALANRLGDLKAQGLILPEEAEDLVRSNSREEVREKIRELVDLGTFPPADAKKLDEAQVLTSPSDYNQLVEVRKVEELQSLRAVQSEFAQTPTFKSTAARLAQKEEALSGAIDPSLIKKEDLGGRKDLIETYEKLAAAPRPVNSGQFPTITPVPEDEGSSRGGPGAGSGVCPEGAVLDSSRGGCIWVDGRVIDDYSQYQCDQPRHYYSFAAKKCIAYKGTVLGYKEDAQPICPVGYLWSWYTNSCESQGRNTLPTPTSQPEPEDEAEIEKQNGERSKYCPQGASYKIPRGCVWDDTDKELHDSSQYRCSSNQYYSFDARRCVGLPAKGEPSPEDATPVCREDGAFWSWTDGKCIPPAPTPTEEEKRVWSSGIGAVDPPKPWATPDSPFYFFKQAGETVRLATALTPKARAQVQTSIAQEKLAESYAALEKGDKEAFAKSLADYSARMQDVFKSISNSSISEEDKKALGERLAQTAVEQNLLLQKMEVIAKDEDTKTLSTVSSTVVLGVDKAADLSGEPAIPEELKAKIESLPADMISEEDKKGVLEADSRVKARLKLGDLVKKGGLSKTDTVFLDEDFDQVDREVRWKIEELKKLEEFAEVAGKKQKLEEKVKKNEDIVEKLAEFEKTFEVGKEVPADIRPYVRLTRIEEVAQTIRPDIVKLEEFQNRKDLVLAVATLQEEFRPTQEAVRRVEEFRRRNPVGLLPPELARIEALYYSLGVREQAGPCFLPTPPFAPNTPCPAPGAAIPIASYTTSTPVSEGGPATYNWQTSVDKDGKPLVYGQGPEPVNTGVCPDGYHWMYDSGGWCMSNSGSYSSSYSYTPTGTGAGYTPYSPYYTAPGAPPGTYGYPTVDNNTGDGCLYGSDRDSNGICEPIEKLTQSASYSAPSYYGTAPTSYTTTPPAGTVPGSGPAPIAPQQCPSGYHWMSDSGGWCMADNNTYVPAGTAGGASSSGGSSGGSYNYSTPSSYEYGCTPGSFWNGSQCQKGDYEGPGWSDSAAQSTTWCQPPSAGCGSGKYWDYGSCSCRTSTVYSSGGGSSSGGSSSSSGSCPSGSHWMSENGGYCMSDSAPSGSSGGSTSSGGGSSSVSCPSGYHSMDNSWCMSDAERDGGSSGGSTSTSTTDTSTTDTSTSTTTSEPASSETTSSEPSSEPTSSEPSSSEPSSSEPAPSESSESAPSE